LRYGDRTKARPQREQVDRKNYENFKIEESGERRGVFSELSLRELKMLLSETIVEFKVKDE
jgi:hypothetical protein